MSKLKLRWLAGYGNFMDWYIVPDTEENREAYADFDGDTYETFAEAKKALIEQVGQRLLDDRNALKSIRKVKKAGAL